MAATQQTTQPMPRVDEAFGAEVSAGGQHAKLEALSSDLRGFLSKTSRAYQALQGDSDEGRFDAYEVILELSDDLPEFIDRVEQDLLKVTAVPDGMKKKWLDALREASKDAAYLPKGISKNPELMADWLGNITKPVRKVVRWIEPAVKRARQSELSKERAPRSKGNSKYSESLKREILKDFPDLAKQMFGEGAEKTDDEDKSTTNWVDQQWSGQFVNVIKNKSQLLLPPRENQLMRVSIIIVGNASTPASKALEWAGYKVTSPLGQYLNIANALVVAGPKPRAFMNQFRRDNPASIVRKKNLRVYPKTYNYRGRKFHLLLPKKALDGLDVEEWSFTV